MVRLIIVRVVVAEKGEGVEVEAETKSISQSVHEMAAYWNEFGDRVSAFEKAGSGAAAIYGSGFYGTFIHASLEQPEAVVCFSIKIRIDNNKSCSASQSYRRKPCRKQCSDCMSGLTRAWRKRNWPPNRCRSWRCFAVTVQLRAPVKSDFSLLAALRNDESIQRQLMIEACVYLDAEVQAWIRRRTDDPQGAFWAVDADGARVCAIDTNSIRFGGFGDLFGGECPRQGRGYESDAVVGDGGATARLPKIDAACVAGEPSGDCVLSEIEIFDGRPQAAAAF